MAQQSNKRGAAEIGPMFLTKLEELCTLMNEAQANDLKIEFAFASDQHGNTSVGKFEVWEKYRGS